MSLVRQIKDIVEGQPSDLIEHVAEQIASAILKSQPKVQEVSITIKKPHVAVSGIVDALGIEITRTRCIPAYTPKNV